ncbi:hypothetical protein PG991_003272 [Apiospora marii]|uniref:Zn(2)-C6 fungal-type domain-containing protein n=1 Tax=Apiospora marii TaxID=335849 RepID=A0ABR1SJH8_9PEZI
MVNRGKPSLDCRPCKKRKLRCDLQRDVCGQCSRASIKCFGRRDSKELIILDQTASTQQKVQGAQLVRASDLATRQTTYHHPFQLIPDWFSYASSVPAFAAIPSPLPPALEVRARVTFFAHYVFGFSRSHGALAALYQATASDSPLSAAVDAAAFLFLARQYEAPGYATTQATSSSRQGSGLTRLATASYVLATRRLSSALRAESPFLLDECSGNAKGYCPQTYGDETLQAVLLLDLYEKLAVTGIQRPGAAVSPRIHVESWMSHVRGALSLLRASGLGHDGLESSVKRRLAARLAMTMVVSCGAAGVHVPHELERLRAGLAPYFVMAGTDAPLTDQTIAHPTLRLDPKFAVTGVVVGVVNLAADVVQISLAPEQVCSRAQDLDRQFVEMELALPPSWHYERVTASSGYPMVYGGYYDLYADHFVTQVRNVVRSMRLLLASLVMKCDGTERRYQHRPTRADFSIEPICDDIVASVPQFTWAMARYDNTVPFGLLQSLQCFTLLSPLYMAGQMTARPELREWIITTMEYMAESGGLYMARLVANTLRDAPETNYWHVYAMLGSYAFAA